MEQSSGAQPIDLEEIARLLVKQRRFIAKVCGIVGLLVAIYVFSIPRSYDATVVLAPESSTGASLSGNIGSLANMVGISLGSSMSGDALYPEIYPEVVGSTDFIVGLFDVKVRTADGQVNTTLYDYIAKEQKTPWWGVAFSGVRKLMKMFKSKSPRQTESEGRSAFWLTEEEDEICKAISGCMLCSVDKKTGMITLGFIAQDPLVAASMTDSIKQKLQDFIIEYKTTKARNDLIYFNSMLEESKQNYEQAQRVYSDYCDTHKSTALQVYASRQDFLENQLQLAYTSYSQWMQQVQIAKAKLQEKTPSFTVVSSVSVPLRPSKPKRVITLMASLVFAFLASALYVYGKDQILNTNKKMKN